MAALDQWIAGQPEPQPSRPEAIRRLLGDKLKSQGYLKGAQRGASDAQAAGRAYAKGKAGAALDRVQSGSSHSDDVKAHRKRKLTTVPAELGGPTRAKAEPRRARPASKGD